jgi:hypothetical protein
MKSSLSSSFLHTVFLSTIIAIGILISSCGTVLRPVGRTAMIKSVTGVELANPLPDKIVKAEYAGDKNAKQQADGDGKAVWFDANGNVVMRYEGEFQNGEVQGDGKATYTELQATYEGQWTYSFPWKGSFESLIKKTQEERDEDPFAEKKTVKSNDGKTIDVAPIFDKNQLDKNLIYPDFCRVNGLSAKFSIWVLIDANGRQIQYKLNDFRESMNPLFAISAINAIKLTPFTAAKSGTTNVESWVSVPVLFELPKP